MNDKLATHIQNIRRHVLEGVASTFRQAGGPFQEPFLAPGSTLYHDCVWDWDSWMANVALRQAVRESSDSSLREAAVRHGRGSIIDLLAHADERGWVPICVYRDAQWWRTTGDDTNMAKPVLAQHAAFLIEEDGDAEWIRPWTGKLAAFLERYRKQFLHAPSGLYIWADDAGIGVDNDPCTFFRPVRSSASIYLNALMLREWQAMAFILDTLKLDGAETYRTEAVRLADAIRRHCWDEWTGFYYSCDVNLLPVDPKEIRHSGAPRNWPCLIQRIQVWSGFLALWAGIATPEQADRIAGHWRDARTFGGAYGVRTLSKLEAMYELRACSNPSCWLGPVWGVSNYLTFRGFVRYGLLDDARDLAERTIRLFGEDLERTGTLHEYYDPDSGQGIISPDFQNWNYLALNMAAWLEGQPVAAEWEPRL
jgi:putative isomerase